MGFKSLSHKNNKNVMYPQVEGNKKTSHVLPNLNLCTKPII